MSFKKSYLLILITLLSFTVPAKKPVINIYLIGDSTVADYSLEKDYATKRDPLNGWGQVFQPFFVRDSLSKVKRIVKGDQVLVIDKAKGGRSTRTFFEEGRWKEVFDSLKTNDIVMIQFGHNDAAKNKPERYVDIPGYKDFLRMYVKETRQKGAYPILITPVNRNSPWADGKLSSSHGEYPQAVKDVAAELNVPLIDLTQLSIDHFTAKGKDYISTRYFMNLPANTYPAYPNGQKDNTHFQKEGAVAVAQLVFDGLKMINKQK